MFRKSLLVLLGCLVLGLPVTASAGDRVLYVLVDAQHQRAYVPEGTVLPPGLKIRAEPLHFQTPSLMDGPLFHAPHRGAAAKHLTSAPLVFEYAPSERFEVARQHYLAKHPASTSGSHRAEPATDDCFDVYVSDSQVGAYDTYYDGLTSRVCVPSGTLYVGYSYTWTFTVTGDYSDDDFRIDPYVGISDNDNNFNCFHAITWGESGPTCSASATTQVTNTYCVNTVYTFGLLYKIEYTNDPYHDNYYGFVLEVDWCTAFY